MDHAYAEEHGLVDRYHRGLLPPEEEAAFEEHYFSCPECTELLEIARGFERGMKALAAEEAARASLAVQVGLFAWLARRGRAARWGLALSALLLAAALPALWYSAQHRDLERRLAASERRALESKLAQATPAPSPGGAETLLANLPVVLLTAVRGPGEPATTIDLARTGPLVALAVDPGPATYASYRATLDRGGAPLFRQGGLKPNALETLLLTVPAATLAPGDYRLRIEGLKADGTAAEIGAYPFRIEK